MASFNQVQANAGQFAEEWGSQQFGDGALNASAGSVRTRSMPWAEVIVIRHKGNGMRKRIGLALFMIVSLTGYCGLAVWGGGGVARFFSNPARTGLVVVMLALSVATVFSNSSGLGAGVREDQSNRWVLLPLIGVSLLLAWLPAYLDRHNELAWGADAVRWVGLALCAVGGYLRVAPVFALGRRFSGLVAIQPGHALKTDGLYRVIRHPSYLGLILGTLGWALVFRCVLPGVIITAIIAATLVARMNSEETLLLDQFQDEYREYRRRTWRLIPWVYLKRKEPLRSRGGRGDGSRIISGVAAIRPPLMPISPVPVLISPYFYSPGPSQ